MSCLRKVFVLWNLPFSLKLHFLLCLTFLLSFIKTSLFFSSSCSLIVRFFRRRGSNLSLLLDVSSLGVEPVCSVSTPKEVWLQLLHTSSRPLTHMMLQQAAVDTQTLNTEYQVTKWNTLCFCTHWVFWSPVQVNSVTCVSPPQKIPPNFVSAAELDVPGHMIKDRYKTILPSQ